jgi:hypothetical protein
MYNTYTIWSTVCLNILGNIYLKNSPMKLYNHNNKKNIMCLTLSLYILIRNLFIFLFIANYFKA